MISIGTFDNFNHRGRRRQGIDRAGRVTDLRNADGAVAGRGRHRIWPARRSRGASRRFLLGDLSAAQGSALARRQAGDAGRRDLLDRDAEEAKSVATRPIIGTSSRPRRPASATSSSPSTCPATANCRPSSANSPCCRSIGGKAPTAKAASATSPRPRWRSRWAPAPTGSRISLPAGRSALERVKDYWGANLPRPDRPEQFRRNALRIFPRQSRRAGGVQGRPGRLDRGEFGQAMGDRL